MGDQRYSLPRVRVLRDGHDPLEVQILNPDLLRWDLTRGKHRWPTMREAPNLWMTFIAWAAAVRTGATADRWETFRDGTLEVRNVGADDDDESDPAAEGWSADPDAEGPGEADPFRSDLELG